MCVRKNNRECGCLRIFHISTAMGVPGITVPFSITIVSPVTEERIISSKCLQTHSNTTQQQATPITTKLPFNPTCGSFHTATQCVPTHVPRLLVCNCCSKTWDSAKSANLLHLFLVTYIIAHITDQPGKNGRLSKQ